MRMESLPLTAGTENGREWSLLLVNILKRELMERFIFTSFTLHFPLT